MSRTRLLATALSSLVAMGALSFGANPANASVNVQSPQVVVDVQPTDVYSAPIATTVKTATSGNWVLGTKYPSLNGTLAGISKSAYNNAGYWPGLCQVNKLPNCDLIAIGQKLYVPITPPVGVAPQVTKVSTPAPKIVKAKPAPKTTVATKATTVSHVSGGNAATVVAYARAQVGKGYVWAASGPNVFDCSGLVAAAYARVGVKLPHQSESMLSYGKVVSKANLQPGDIIWPYHGHVMIYIGNGQVVEAANPQQGVRISNIYAFMTARRIL